MSNTPSAPNPVLQPGATAKDPKTGKEAPAGHFIQQAIERDLAQGTYASRRWAGQPGDAAAHSAGLPDGAKVRVRFPPEPNGYLHLGHAKSICLNFDLAQQYGGAFHLRFDDTNPEKEEQEFVTGIADAMRWLGVDWGPHLYHASNYFEFMLRAAEHLIERGLAYVDEQSPEDMRARRGDFNTPGQDSPFRTRTPAENLERFRHMQSGQMPEGAAVVRAKIDMASPNINLRDPAIYRIKHAAHHNTGTRFCVYPMYAYAHPIEDALENITHSICTLEFEDQRPWYDWLLERLIEGGLLQAPPPRQYEFARLSVNHIVTSKRKLKELVDDAHVSGWDDPRMPTLVGMRRRGYTPTALRNFVRATGVTKSGGGWVEYGMLEQFLRDDLDPSAQRAMAVLDPLKLVITNWAAGPAQHHAPVHPHDEARGQRSFDFSRELWIEREDFQEAPEKGYHRLFVGNRVRLKYGYVVECTGFEKDANGRITQVHATCFEDSKSGTPTSGNYKTKAVITWVSASDAVAAEVRLYDRLFATPQPGTGDTNYLADLNPSSLKTVQAWVEPGLAQAAAETQIQFERHGYFVADRFDHAPAASPARLVFNRTVGLKDSWGK